MLHIVERPHTCQADLGALLVSFPVLAPLLELLPRAMIHLLVHLDRLYTLALRAVDLPPRRLIVLGRVRLRGIDALLGDGHNRISAEIFREVLLGLLFHATPYRIEVLIVQEHGDEHARNLTCSTERGC